MRIPARENSKATWLEVPVVDITEAAASTATFLGHQYSVVTTLDRTVPLIEDRLKLAGLDARCASVRAIGLGVPELGEFPDRAIAAIIDQAQRAVEEDKAEVTVLECGGMAGLDEQIRTRLRVPVVDGVGSRTSTGSIQWLNQREQVRSRDPRPGNPEQRQAGATLRLGYFHGLAPTD